MPQLRSVNEIEFIFKNKNHSEYEPVKIKAGL